MMTWLRRKVALWLAPELQAIREEREQATYENFVTMVRSEPAGFFGFAPEFKISRRRPAARDGGAAEAA